MKPIISSQLRVKRGGNKTALAYCDYPAVTKATQHFNLGPHLAYNRSPYEDCVERTSVNCGNFEIFLETIYLATEGVPLNHHVHDPEEGLGHANVSRLSPALRHRLPQPGRQALGGDGGL